MLNTEFSPWPSFSVDEANAVSAVLLSNKVNYWTGSEGRNFEKEFAKFADCKYGVAVANGTLALDLALVALGIGRNNGGSIDDEVIVTSRTFLASASSIVTAGAQPIFSDVALYSQNITVETIRKKISKKTKAIICVHLAGFPCEMDEIMLLANEFDIKVIEDCAQAHGAKYKTKSVGSFGHIAAWSFCQDKIMTTGGEGGMVTCNNETLWKKMWSYKDHGKSWDAIYNNKNKPVGFQWLHETFGTNWRLTEMQSAIGRIQLKKIDEWVALRNRNANLIEKSLAYFPSIRLLDVPEYVVHAQYKYYAFVKPEMLKQEWGRDRIVEEINKKGVPCFQGTCSEVYLERAFVDTGFVPSKRLDIAKELGETSIMFLVHPTLTTEEFNKTCTVINHVLSIATIQN